MSDDEAETRDSSSEANRTRQRQSERRHHLRFPFTASVEAIEPRSHSKLSARTSDLGLGGCYVDTMNPFAVGTVIKVRLTKDDITFEADAKVTFSQVGMGMGVTFISATPRQLQIFQKWLNELAGKLLPELEPREGIGADAVAANLMEKTDFVLHELLITLMKKGVLSEVEGKQMLQRLNRYPTILYVG
jgi:hypothetical protein